MTISRFPGCTSVTEGSNVASICPPGSMMMKSSPSRLRRQVVFGRRGGEEPVVLAIAPNLPARLASDPEADRSPLGAHVVSGGEVYLGPGCVDFQTASVPARHGSIVVPSRRPTTGPLVLHI